MGNLTGNIDGSLNSTSQTRWSARIDAVKPIAQKLLGILKSLREVEQKLDNSAESKTDLKALTKYFSSFKALILLATWFKIIQAIDYRSKVLQSRDSTIDEEQRNLQSLVENLKHLRNNWDAIYNEACFVAEELNITPQLKERIAIARELRGSSEEHKKAQAVSQFKIDVFLPIIDNAIAGIDRRFQSMHEINNKFSFLWQYPNISETELSKKASTFADVYKDDI